MSDFKSVCNIFSRRYSDTLRYASVAFLLTVSLYISIGIPLFNEFPVYNVMHCKFGNFRENIIFVNSVKILGHNLLQIDVAISQGFYFRETPHPQSFSKINPRKNFRSYSITNSFSLLSGVLFSG